MGVGSRHCGVALSSGKLFMWGDATHGQLAGISQTDSTAQSRKAMKKGTKVEIIFGKRKGCEGILISEVKPKRWLVSIKNPAKNKTEKVEYPENKFRSTIAPSPPPLFPSMMITLPQQVKMPIKVRGVRAWCSSARRENLSFILHLLTALTPYHSLISHIHSLTRL